MAPSSCRRDLFQQLASDYRYPLATYGHSFTEVLFISPPPPPQVLFMFCGVLEFFSQLDLQGETLVPPSVLAQSYYRSPLYRLVRFPCFPPPVDFPFPTSTRASPRASPHSFVYLGLWPPSRTPCVWHVFLLLFPSSKEDFFFVSFSNFC